MKPVNNLLGVFNKHRVTVLFVLILVVAATIGAPVIKHQLNSWKLLPQPERLTELYFTNPNHLPATYVPGQTQTVSFTIHNLEYRNTEYSYVVKEVNQDSTVTQTLASASFSIDQNQFKAVSLDITPLDLGSYIKIVVDLQTKGQLIDYLLTKATL